MTSSALEIKVKPVDRAATPSDHVPNGRPPLPHLLPDSVCPAHCSHPGLPAAPNTVLPPRLLLLQDLPYKAVSRLTYIPFAQSSCLRQTPHGFRSTPPPPRQGQVQWPPVLHLCWCRHVSCHPSTGPITKANRVVESDFLVDPSLTVMAVKLLGCCRKRNQAIAKTSLRSCF